MLIADAQRDLRRAYVGGGPGVLISGAIWSATALVEARYGTATAFATLFFGGMVIFPGSKIVCRTLFHRADEASGNPFGGTALESTIAMIAGLFAAWLFLPSRPALVLPLAAIAVGTHYLVFRTIYGDRLFWLLAGVITVIGLADIFVAPLRGVTALLVAGTELAVGLVLTRRAAKSPAAGVA